MTVEELITEMQEVKATHPNLEINEILQMFNIVAMQDLTSMIRRVV